MKKLIAATARHSSEEPEILRALAASHDPIVMLKLFAIKTRQIKLIIPTATNQRTNMRKHGPKQKKPPAIMQNLITLTRFGTEEFLDLHAKWDFEVLGKRHYVEIDGNRWSVSMDSERYQVFAKSIECVACKMRGEFFLLQCHPEHFEQRSAHLNLYGIGADGKEVLFTKDHIIPKAKGGGNNLRNYQTMCAICNVEKADKLAAEPIACAN